MKKVITLEFEKETPGTYRFKEINETEELIVPSLYIKKRAFEEEEERPEKITVTIESK